MNDVAIIGTGAAGAFCAYHLAKRGVDVALYDAKERMEEGASMAAGAFLSPMIASDNQLRRTCNSALIYAFEFYRINFPDLLLQRGLLRFPKNEREREKFVRYAGSLEFAHQKSGDGYFFKEGGLIDPQALIPRLLADCTLHLGTRINRIEKSAIGYLLNGVFEAKEVIVATGAAISLPNLPYIKIHPTWGQRLECEGASWPYNIHAEVSLSTNRKNGSFAIGATNYKGVMEAGLSQEDEKWLLAKAKALLPFAPKVLASYGGARASSYDSLPVIGEVIDTKRAICERFETLKGREVDPSLLPRSAGLYLINGLGARGFVYGPYVADKLIGHILDKEPIDPHLGIEKHYYSFAKRIKRGKGDGPEEVLKALGR